MGFDELAIILSILKLAEKVQLQKFSEGAMILVLKMLWNVVSNQYHLKTT